LKAILRLTTFAHSGSNNSDQSTEVDTVQLEQSTEVDSIDHSGRGSLLRPRGSTDPQSESGEPRENGALGNLTHSQNRDELEGSVEAKQRRTRRGQSDYDPVNPEDESWRGKPPIYL
jgi:hypothetical protein